MRALKVPVDPSHSDALSPLPVEVRESEEHRPLSVRPKRRWREICGIDDHWEFDLW